MEGRLEQSENEWAKFCENASNVKAKLEDNNGKWKEFISDCEKMSKTLNEYDGDLATEIKRGFELHGIDIELKKIKVFYLSVVLLYFIIAFNNMNI